jgi:hypothetical protein
LLYHFTDRRNIASIKKLGLLSWWRLKQKKITHYPASNQFSRNLDFEANLGDYVRLCKNKKHPMAYRAFSEGRISNYVWLEIKADPMFWGTTKFSDKNATASNATLNSTIETFLHSTDNQAEVLIKGSLGTKWIKSYNG